MYSSITGRYLFQVKNIYFSKMKEQYREADTAHKVGNIKKPVSWKILIVFWIQIPWICIRIQDNVINFERKKIWK